LHFAGATFYICYGYRFRCRFALPLRCCVQVMPERSTFTFLFCLASRLLRYVISPLPVHLLRYCYPYRALLLYDSAPYVTIAIVAFDTVAFVDALPLCLPLPLRGATVTFYATVPLIHLLRCVPLRLYVAGLPATRRRLRCVAVRLRCHTRCAFGTFVRTLRRYRLLR